MATENKTIVFFHTGRGGRFNNSGHVTFCGTKNIEEVLQLNDSGKNNSSITKENAQEIYEMLKGRNLPNILELFEKCRDEDDYSEFERKTGLELGEDIYADFGGTQIITLEEVETGVGILNWDNDYDTDECKFLADCEEKELQLISDSDKWDKESIVQEFFNGCTDVKMDWNKFNGNYNDLITAYFNFEVVPEEFYHEEIKKFVLAYDSGAKGTRYVSEFDENGTTFSDSARMFDNREDAEKFNEDKNWVCWVEEIDCREVNF